MRGGTSCYIGLINSSEVPQQQLTRDMPMSQSSCIVCRCSPMRGRLLGSGKLSPAPPATSAGETSWCPPWRPRTPALPGVKGVAQRTWMHCPSLSSVSSSCFEDRLESQFADVRHPPKVLEPFLGGGKTDQVAILRGYAGDPVPLQGTNVWTFMGA